MGAHIFCYLAIGPVLTHTMMNGQTPLVLNVSQLPAGAYIVRCTACSTGFDPAMTITTKTNSGSV